MNPKDIKHIFFDLDHTLWDFDRNSALAFAKIFKKHHISLQLSDFMEAYQPINFQYWKWYREGKVTKDQLRYGRFKKSFNACAYNIDDHLIDKLSTDYITYLPEHNFLFDNTIEVLEYLQDTYKLHIITNGFEEVQHTKLIRSNIARFFDTVTTSEEAGVKKPDPIIFNKAMHKTNATPETSLMIGDTYEADILGANQVGMHSICFNYHNHDLPDYQIVINKLIELKQLL